uniref:Uncharacterized protein n=1 Tax=Rhizophora mucronata TaxID=61149 RepID=A0A2P2K2A8_RHIMU
MTREEKRVTRPPESVRLKKSSFIFGYASKFFSF